jgi:hypothetical protein
VKTSSIDHVRSLMARATGDEKRDALKGLDASGIADRLRSFFAGP